VTSWLASRTGVSAVRIPQALLRVLRFEKVTRETLAVPNGGPIDECVYSLNRGIRPPGAPKKKAGPVLSFAPGMTFLGMYTVHSVRQIICHAMLLS